MLLSALKLPKNFILETKYNQTDGHTLVGSGEELDSREDRQAMARFKNKISDMELNAQVLPV